MIKTFAIFALTVSGLIFPVISQAETLDGANRSFVAGHYDESTLSFRTILEEKGYSAPVLFDLGNSLYREGDFAQAILAYKRAQWLSPNDSDIAANLRFAQKQAGISVAEPSWGERISHVLNASGWAWVGSGAWTLLCASLLARTIWPQRRSLFFLSGSASGLVLVAAVAAILLSSNELRQAVVIDKKASALISPFPAAQVVFTPTPGETMTVQKSYDGFLLVSDQTGHTGWISKTQITPIIPSPSKG